MGSSARPSLPYWVKWIGSEPASTGTGSGVHCENSAGLIANDPGVGYRFNDS